MSFSTELFSGDVNPVCALKVGTIMQQSLDGECFQKPVKVSEATFVLDDLKLFNRLISIADRELSLFEGLAYELT